MIIGITGTLGAGKGTVVDYLKSKGFIHRSARAFITDEIKRRGLPINRDAMVLVANDLREQFGPGYVIESLFKEAIAEDDRAVIESVRTLGEAEFLKNHGALIIAVDADRPLRYKRIVERGSETDDISFEKFVSDEQREWTAADPTKQNLLAVIESADYNIVNNGTVPELYAEVDSLLQKIAER